MLPKIVILLQKPSQAMIKLSIIFIYLRLIIAIPIDVI